MKIDTEKFLCLSAYQLQQIQIFNETVKRLKLCI